MEGRQEKQRKDRRIEERIGLWGRAKGRSATPRGHGPHILKETRLKEIRQSGVFVPLWSNMFHRRHAHMGKKPRGQK